MLKRRENNAEEDEMYADFVDAPTAPTTLSETALAILQFEGDRAWEVKDEEQIPWMVPNSNCIVHPKSSAVLNWQKMMLVCTLFVAVAVPYELAFTKQDNTSNLFWLHRLVDLLFVIDIIVTCNTAIPIGRIWEEEETASGLGSCSSCSQVTPYSVEEKSEVAPNSSNNQVLEEEPGGVLETNRIRLVYKYWWSGWFAVDILSVFPFYLFDSNMQAVRLIRLLRLVKLSKIAKSMDILRVSDISLYSTS